MADLVVSLATRLPQVLQEFRNNYSRAWCVRQLVRNMTERVRMIRLERRRNVDNAPNGTNIPDTITRCRRLFRAIGDMLQDYANYLNNEQKQTLVDLLMHILEWIVAEDPPAGPNAGPAYASTSSHLNLYRRWLSQAGEPQAFLEVLQNLSNDLKQRQAARIYNMYVVIANRSTNEPQQEQQRSRAVATRLWHISGGK